ncbi:hypothetical protein LMG7141_00931 [Ralstonia condita]|jgi:hypothetical protein|uniref:Uncharacterized protein n=1 Tax=Ralstonia condita TaxID=3058600 RepID=A0ABM9J218_9RALS|nr:hypothetical protein [Ralstonia sp. LMG 7141]CAJ0779790.1 hypothetical protein LMG7141_00931 [Ralstonia sp. LMG 7141]
MYTARFCATACPCPRIDFEPGCPQSKEDILQAYAVLFWFNFYLRCPEFPATDGMFPRQPDVRRAYLQVHAKVFAHWATAANRIGIPTARFRDTCVTVRAAWIGAGDPLLACRSRAGALSGYPSMDLD